MAAINYLIRSTSKEPASIYVRLRTGRTGDYWAKSGLSVVPADWSSKTQMIRQRAGISDKDKINDKLTRLKSFVLANYNAAGGFIHRGWLEDTVTEFHDREAGKNTKLTLFTFIRDFIDKSGTRLNPKSSKPIDYKQRNEYKVTFGHLKEFAGNRELNFKDVDLNFYHDFMKFLEDKNFAANTIGRKIQTLKIFMNAALEEGKTTHQGHKSKRFKAPKEEPETVALTLEELEVLSKLDLSDNPRLDRTRDLFLISCWTGCRFGDLIKIRPEDVQDDMLNLIQHKTGARVIVPLHPVVKAIMTKHGGMPKPLSNQKFNKNIQDLCKLAGFTDPIHVTKTRGGVERIVKFQKYQLITSHTGRRTFATIHYKAGFPAISLMRITGHKSEAAFLRYLRITDEEHALRLREFWQKNADYLRVVK